MISEENAIHDCHSSSGFVWDLCKVINVPHIEGLEAELCPKMSF